MPGREKLKKVDRRTKCVGISLVEEDYNRLVEYMNLFELTESSALLSILMDNYEKAIGITVKWKNQGEARQLKMYMSSRQYNLVKNLATSKHMKTNAYIRCIVMSYLRAEFYEEMIMCKSVLETPRDEDDFVDLSELYD